MRGCHAGPRAARSCCLGPVQHRMGIYLRKGAKAGCSSQNKALTSQRGAWDASLGLTRNPAPGITVALEPLDSVQGCSSVKVASSGVIVRVLYCCGEASSCAQRSLQEPEGAGVTGGASEGAPDALASWLDRWRIWGEGCWGQGRLKSV